MRQRILIGLALALAACGPADPDRVDAERHDRFWLWAGVQAPKTAAAREWYLLDGEIRAAGPRHFVPLRPGIPRIGDSDVWLVVRTDTLDWPDGGAEALARRADRWARNGSRVVGIQLDFDARTRSLDDYAEFLAEFRRRLPARYRLSITGLMDWSANGDPAALKRLGGIVDEVVIQTYQGRETIPGYEFYFDRMRGFPIPFKVGLVEGGRWVEPGDLAEERNFKGYVVFLVNDARTRG
ncbi:MAG TPA: DUF3142 domain-containing protein [Sphingomicrobium sp.]